MLIFRRSYCIITASGIVIVCKRLYITPIDSGILKMSIVLLETS